MVLFHESSAVLQAQDPSFTPDGLADQEGFRLRVVEASGMKLDEFHVGDDCPGTVSHSDAVARRDVRV